MARCGTDSGYSAGCHCDQCRTAHRHKQAAWRRGGVAGVDALALPRIGELPDSSWATRAACAGTDPALFFPERGEPLDPARAVCAICLVSEECLDWALRTSQKFGIWGGRSEKERRLLKTRRRLEEAVVGPVRQRMTAS